MRIVAYTNLYMPTCRAGAQMMLRDLLRPLQERHDISIVIDNGRGLTEPYTWEGIQVFPDAQRAHELRVTHSADLIITHLQATFPATQIAQECDIPVVQVLHANEIGEHEYLRHKCDLVVFNSYSVRDSFPYFTGPSIVIYPPVSPEEYRTQPGKEVSLVNIADIKGSGIFYALAEEFPDVQFHGVLGGYGNQDVRSMPNVTIGESVDDMTQVYGRTKIVLMPSVYESFGRCAIEAAASGIPTIAASTPGLRESLGGAGIFCDYDDLPAWRAALQRLLVEDNWAEASRRTLERSSVLAEVTETQMSEWCEAIESFEGVPSVV
ncbi:glycosyltransferase family 4 protein [Flindersiella endophytica]